MMDGNRPFQFVRESVRVRAFFFGHCSSQRACSRAFSIRMLRLSHCATCLHIPHVVRLLLFECRIVYSLGVPHVHPYSRFSYSPNWIKCRFKSHEVGRTCEHSMCDNLERRQTICPNGTGACEMTFPGGLRPNTLGSDRRLTGVCKAYGCLQGKSVVARLAQHRYRQGQLQRRFWDVIRVARLPVDPCCLFVCLIRYLCLCALSASPSCPPPPVLWCCLSRHP